MTAKAMMVGVVATLLSAAAIADDEVTMTKTPPKVDGKLDDVCWREAAWQGGSFAKRKCERDKTVTQQTEFAIAADADNVYVAVRAYEDNMEAVRAHAKPDMFGGDYVEIYFAPSGLPFDFYHFTIAPTYDMTCTIFYSEGGLTTPDPYAPEWQYGVDLGEKCWTVELAVPLRSLYMTRNAEWKDVWRFNVSRLRAFAKPCELSSWSTNLEYKFPEVKNFNLVKGFPIRAAKDDVSMTAAAVKIDGKKEGKIVGDLSLRVYVDEPGAYVFKSEYCDTTELELKNGFNEVRVRCAFDGPARYKIPMELVRKADGRRYWRKHDVVVAYEALTLRMEKPQYRNNFYPGQCSDEICGTCVSAFDKPVEVTIEGKKVKRATQTCGADGSFRFKTPGLREKDEVKLVFRCDDDVREIKVRKLAKPKRRATWIEDGHLVMDGKPFFRLNMYGWNRTGGYRCSKPFMEKVLRDDSLGCTMKMTPEDLQFSRLVRGAKQTEGNRDVMPSQKVFDAIDERINELKDTDFGYYYIMDEPECGGVSPVYMRHIYEHICEKDPYHVTLMCSQAVDRFIDTVDCMEPHPYLTPRINEKGEREYPRPMYTMGAPADRFARHNRRDKVIGVTSAAFAFRELSRNYDYPTFDEYQANTWAMILGGAKSVFPFILDCAGHRACLYEGTRYMFSSLKALEGFLLLGDRKRLVKDKEHEVVVWEHSGQRMFAVLSYREVPQTVKVEGVGAGDYAEFRGKRSWSIADGGSLELSLRPFELVIGTTVKLDEGLASREAVERKIVALEWARTHRDNQLFEKDQEIKMSLNGAQPKTLSVNLVDGVLDAEALMVRGKGLSLELQFTKGPVTFRQVHLYGSASLAKGFAVDVFVRGEWKELDASAAEIAGFDTLTTLPETVTAERVRFRFRDNVTLHEIELPRMREDGVR